MDEVWRIEHYLIEDREESEKYFFSNNFTEVSLKLLSTMNISLITDELTY